MTTAVSWTCSQIISKSRVDVSTSWTAERLCSKPLFSPFLQQTCPIRKSTQSKSSVSVLFFVCVQWDTLCYSLWFDAKAKVQPAEHWAGIIVDLEAGRWTLQWWSCVSGQVIVSVSVWNITECHPGIPETQTNISKRGFPVIVSLGNRQKLLMNEETRRPHEARRWDVCKRWTLSPKYTSGLRLHSWRSGRKVLGSDGWNFDSFF